MQDKKVLNSLKKPLMNGFFSLMETLDESSKSSHHHTGCTGRP
jgi:hypothetical protein